MLLPEAKKARCFCLAWDLTPRLARVCSRSICRPAKAGNLRYVHDAYCERFDVLYKLQERNGEGATRTLMNEQLNECDIELNARLNGLEKCMIISAPTCSELGLTG